MVFLWWCFCGGVCVVMFVWCGCVFVVVWWCFCHCGGVFVIVVKFLFWCFCGGVVVLVCFCGGVFVVAWWCFCGGVLVVF